MENELHDKTNLTPKAQSFFELIRFAFLALLVVIPVRVLVAEPFVVSGSSMAPTFADGNYLIVEKLSYKFSDPERDDVVVFRYPNDHTKFFIKRIIGLPGETVDIRGNTVTIKNEEHKQGFRLEEPYVKNNSNNDISFKLGSEEYFVMGDNRSASSDSRYWGPVERNLIKGRTFLRLLPIDEMSLLPGDYKQSAESN